jgi:preprotein translocase subunit SecD
MWKLVIALRTEGAAKLEALTRAHIGKPLVMLVDGEIVSVATVEEVMSDGITIAGAIDEDEIRGILDSVR